MVEEPVAYATGSPELKDTGPSNSGFQTPRNIRTRRAIEVANWTNEEGSRYAPAMIASGVPIILMGRGRVVSGTRRNPKSLEMKAIATHRAHVEALAAWGHAFHLATCPICGSEESHRRGARAALLVGRDREGEAAGRFP